MNNKIKALPESIKKYFWDCDFETLNMETHSFYISERIMNLGDIPSILWLLSEIDISQLKKVVEKSRNLDKKTRNYWKLMS